jgi:hypothetical protein
MRTGRGENDGPAVYARHMGERSEGMSERISRLSAVVPSDAGERDEAAA